MDSDMDPTSMQEKESCQRFTMILVTGISKPLMILYQVGFCWPSMLPDVIDFAASCGTCQRTKPVNQKGTTGNIPISGIFET